MTTRLCSRRIRPLLLFALGAFAAIPVEARLGETEAATIARYGPAVGTYEAGHPGYAYRTLTFNHAGFVIIVQFIGADCEMVCFQKSDRSEFTPDDLDLLLKTESDGQAWVRSKLVSIDLIWDRPDGAMARYDTQAHALAFCSAKYLEASGARRSAAEKQKLESL
jgi:hypothetical protein